MHGEIDFNEKQTQRLALALPCRVEVRIDERIAWNEITRLSDISLHGAGFALKRPVKRGRLLSMTVPMPRQLRCFDKNEPQYKVWALVRRCIQISKAKNEESYAIGVAFIGKEPPRSYISSPSNLYELTEKNDLGLWEINTAPDNPDEEDLPKELRRHTRYTIPENVVIEVMDANGSVVNTEVSVTENISYSGAALFSSFDLKPGTFLRFTSTAKNVTIISIVRGHRVGEDGIPRLHIEFIDRFFPLEGIE